MFRAKEGHWLRWLCRSFDGALRSVAQEESMSQELFHIGAWPPEIGKSVPVWRPVVFAYGAARPNISNDVHWVGSIADVRNWVREDRDFERLVVTTVLISVMALMVVVLDARRES